MSTLYTLPGSCLFLLILSQVTCDWVEIEQDNYKPHRKPVISTGHKNFKTQVLPEYEETTKENKIYRNNSVEKLWSKGMIDRVSNVGTIKRVQVPSVKTTAIKDKQEGIEFSKNAAAMEKTGDMQKYREHINIPRRHYFTEPPPPRTTLKMENNEEDFRDKGIKHDKTTHPDFKLTSNFRSSVRKVQDSDEKDVVHINAASKVKQTQILHKNLSRNENNKIYLNDETDNNYNYNYQRIQIGQRGTSPRPNIFNTEEVTTKKIKLINKSQTIQNYNVQNSDQLDDIKYSKHSSSRPFDAYSTKTGDTNENRNDFKKPSPNRPMDFETEMNAVPAANLEGEVPLAPATEDMHANSEDIISKSKNKNTMDGMLKLMKVVSDTIYKNTHRSFKSKLKYLEGLKNSILATIEDHVEIIWPDDEGRTRRVREARGHLEFPSSESALMSISFLTFAVFLIKLVLQVIHTYKNKTMMVAPTVVAAVGRAATAIRNQHQ